MLTFLLIIIYLSFISLGLPDSLLGSAWPSMYPSLGVPVSYAGVISMIITTGTIVSSLNCDKLLKKLGVGKVTTLSVGMTAVALLGFSISPSFVALCCWALPYGLGAGSVDAALNNFVALHYKARHMNWLHCFWGLGASAGPVIMGYCLTGGLGWNGGYRSIFFIQLALTAVLIFSLPLWKKLPAQQQAQGEAAARSPRLPEVLRIPGAKPALTAFLCYGGLETVTGLWGSSYLVIARGVPADLAAKWISLFYLGITAGRLLSGFLSVRLNTRVMVRAGQAIILLGVGALLLPLPNTVSGLGFALVGLGCAPVFPSLLHATPEHFGKELSQSVMGMQMACAYLGSTLLPPLTGLLVERINAALCPFVLLAAVLLMIVMTERLNRRTIVQSAQE